jgi:hypothetical protein
MEGRFDWPVIGRATAIIFASAGAFAMLAPLAGALLVDEVIPLGAEWSTLNVSGHVVYRFLVWAIAWGVTFVMGQRMINEVHERIIDDMLVTSGLAALMLLILKVVVWLVYEPTIYDVNTPQGELLPIVNAVDVGGALLLVVVGLIAARVNQY